MENEFETIDSLNNENEVVNNNDSSQEIDVEKLKETNSKLYARAKEAEAELKRLRSQPKAEAKSVPSTNNTNFVSREDLDLAILQTKNGYDEELIDNLKVISKGKNVSLIQAQEDPLFKLMLEKKEQEMRKAQATLGASRGSTSTTSKKVSEMSREEHMAYVREQMGN